MGNGVHTGNNAPAQGKSYSTAQEQCVPAYSHGGGMCRRPRQILNAPYTPNPPRGAAVESNAGQPQIESYSRNDNAGQEGFRAILTGVSNFGQYVQAKVTEFVPASYHRQAMLPTPVQNPNVRPTADPSSGGRMQSNAGQPPSIQPKSGQVPEEDGFEDACPNRVRRRGELGLLKGCAGGCRRGECCIYPIFYSTFELAKHKIRCESCEKYFRVETITSEHPWMIHHTSRPIDEDGDPTGDVERKLMNHAGGRETPIDPTSSGMETTSIILVLDTVRAPANSDDSIYPMGQVIDDYTGAMREANV